MSNTPSTPSTPSSTPSASESVGNVATEAAQESVSPGEETVEEAAGEAVADKAASGEELTKQEKQELKKWKLKSGKTHKEITSEDELVRLAQLGLGAHEKFEQAAKTRKQAEQILELFQKDPAKALSSLGHDVRKMAEEYLVQEARKQMLSPEEKSKLEIQQEIDRLKAERDDLAREKQEQRITQLQAKYEADIQDQIIGAIDQYKLPKNPKTVARIAEYMANALENGYEASALDVATRVRSDLEEEHRSLFSHYNVDDLVKLLGDDQLKKIRQHDIQKVKAKSVPNPTKLEQIASPKVDSEPAAKKSLSMDDFHKELYDKYLK